VWLVSDHEDRTITQRDSKRRSAAIPSASGRSLAMGGATRRVFGIASVRSPSLAQIEKNQLNRPSIHWPAKASISCAKSFGGKVNVSHIRTPMASPTPGAGPC